VEFVGADNIAKVDDDRILLDPGRALTLGQYLLVILRGWRWSQDPPNRLAIEEPDRVGLASRQTVAAGRSSLRKALLRCTGPYCGPPQ